MGELARTLVSLSGPASVHGIIPRALISTEKGYDGTSIGAQGKASTPVQDEYNRHLRVDPEPRLTGSAAPTPPPQQPSHQQIQNQSAGKLPERQISAAELARLDNNNNPNSDDRRKAPNLLKESEFGTTSVVPDMHTRKRMMSAHVVSGGQGSGFVALAGGYGTAEEVMEMVTWNQLGIHQMPIVLVNVDGYWDGLLAWVRRAVEEGYVSKNCGGILVEVERVEDVVPALQGYQVSSGRYRLDWT